MKKSIYKISRFLAVAGTLALAVPACKKGLDFTNTNAINPANVWNDPNMIRAFLNDIYGGSMPGFSFDGNNSDEGINGPKTLGNYQRGIITPASTFVNLNYTYIDKTNYFLDQLELVSPKVLDPSLKNQYTGEAKFWRAWTYWNMVSALGGVPLILHTQNPLDTTSLKVPRNKTSECIAQIMKDLDSAAMLLPANYPSNTDFGRITKIAAMGLKGKILMWYASPLFNPTNDQSRWQNAYNATKAAVDSATNAGYMLNPNYRNIWYVRNKEMIMVNQFYWSDHPMNFAPIRPLPFTQGSTGSNQPILSLLTAYPKRDGSPMQFDKTQLSNPAYNTQFLTDFYTNRDDRFYASIYCGGTVYPTPDLIVGQTAKTTYWLAFKWDAASNKYNNIFGSVYPGGAQGSEITGFLDRKALDTAQTLNTVGSAQLNGGVAFAVPMRFAELLMNYGECANELGKSSEALDVLYQIRKRANILPGASNNYGVTASSQADIRTAYINEKQVEFAFESQRLPDLRRWKRYDILNSQGARHGLLLVINPTAPLPAPTDNIMNAAVRANFSATYVDNLDGDPTFYFNLDLNHWFYPLNPAQISLEPANLPQNNEWGGSFDPLQ